MFATRKHPKFRHFQRFLQKLRARILINSSFCVILNSRDDNLRHWREKKILHNV